MSDFSTVGLGFAEFVSQLLQETFDATISAQNYQVEKYLELERALSIPESLFNERYLTNEEYLIAENEIFGTTLQSKMIVSDHQNKVIKEIVEDSNTITMTEVINSGQLTNNGFEFLKAHTISFLVDSRKGRIQEMINRNDMARLVVDSGEINAKLEFSNVSLTSNTVVPKASASSKATFINQELKEPQNKNLGLSPELGPGNPIDRFPNPEDEGPKPDIIDEKAPDEPILEPSPNVFSKIKTRELIDPETNEKTILLEKDSIDEVGKINNVLPGVRLIARPIKSSSSSSIFSEITIKFRTV